MRKKHPIRTFFTLLLLAALVAGLAAMPLLTKQAEDGTAASILAGVPERKTLVKTLCSGAPLTAEDSQTVSVPSGVQLTEYLVANGSDVSEGDVIACVDDVSVMTAVKAVQDSLDIISSQLQSARSKIEPGMLTVDDEGKLCINGKQIAQSKLSNYTQFLNLSRQHREYEELLLELFVLHQNGVVTAPCSGTVSDLDETQILKLAATGSGSLKLLALNTPDGDDDEVYNCYVKLIVGINEDGTWQVRTGTTPSVVTDFLDMSGVNLSVSETVDLCRPETVLAFSNGEWGIAQPQIGDILLYAYASDQTYWLLRIANVPVTPEQPDEPEEPTEDPSQDPTEPGEEVPEETKPGGGSETPGSRPGGGTSIDWSQISGMLSGGGRGGSGSGAGSAASNLYSTESAVLCTVTPMQTMTLSLPVDEMDIVRLQPGMTAEITLEALPNQKFSGTVTEISHFGTNNGGSSKFAVKVELPCAEGMLPGMNANVTLTLDTMENCLTVPVAALVEQGSKTVIYTVLDEKTQKLSEPVAVELGFSDGESVQLLSGIPEGTSFYYSYYDVLEISTAVETRGMFG